MSPHDYLNGGETVRQSLAQQRVDRVRWAFPEPDDKAPEAEWGYEPALTDDVLAFARDRGYAA